MSRLGSSLSVFDYMQVGASLSVRGSFPIWHPVTLQSEGDQAKAVFGSAHSYIKYDTNVMDFYARLNNNPIMSLRNGEGRFHGTWGADFEIQYSDRSLKENIRPLSEIVQEARRAPEDSHAPGADGSNSSSSSSSSNSSKQQQQQPQHKDAGSDSQWLLRQISPVAYNYKKSDAEGRRTRFGFIAQDVRRVLPQVTRDFKSTDTMGIIYQDLIAVLTYTLQDLGSGIKTMGEKLASVETRIQQRKHFKAAKKAKRSRHVVVGAAERPAAAHSSFAAA
jgi:hypothetical protein